MLAAMGNNFSLLIIDQLKTGDLLELGVDANDGSRSFRCSFVDTSNEDIRVVLLNSDGSKSENALPIEIISRTQITSVNVYQPTNIEADLSTSHFN